MTTIIDHLIQYLSGLDWGYIITFILLSHLINQSLVKQWLVTISTIKIRTRYRVLIVGILYGTIVYFLRGYTPDKLECLFESFVFAMVFHKLVIQRLFSVIHLNQKPNDTISK